MSMANGHAACYNVWLAHKIFIPLPSGWFLLNSPLIYFLWLPVPIYEFVFSSTCESWFHLGIITSNFFRSFCLFFFSYASVWSKDNNNQRGSTRVWDCGLIHTQFTEIGKIWKQQDDVNDIIMLSHMCCLFVNLICFHRLG